ncbi:NnrU family protein [Rhodoligotrophos defluvii]|uniref:NnrU family protein n=1 Tax=Rhodoligotrophos defluvii TaxID=2561934 RepID=UPI0010C94E40|nr:NnrU family protein [Rhodoligotrophos defluvii]
MSLLILGLVLFFGVHLVPFTPAKAALRARLGEGPYKGGFALIAAVGLILIIWGFASTRGTLDEADMLYYPPAWARHATMALVLLGFICLGIYLHKGRLRLWLRHPMALAIIFWSVGHLISNGDKPGVIVFGAFLVYALLDIAVETARGTRPDFVPKPRHDIIAPLAGIIMYAAMLFLHPYLFGVPVINM